MYGDLRQTTAGSKHGISVIVLPQLLEALFEAQESLAHYSLANPCSKLFVKRGGRRHRLRMGGFQDPLPYPIELVSEKGEDPLGCKRDIPLDGVAMHFVGGVDELDLIGIERKYMEEAARQVGGKGQHVTAS